MNGILGPITIIIILALIVAAIVVLCGNDRIFGKGKSKTQVSSAPPRHESRPVEPPSNRERPVPVRSVQRDAAPKGFQTDYDDDNHFSGMDLDATASMERTAGMEHWEICQYDNSGKTVVFRMLIPLNLRNKFTIGRDRGNDFVLDDKMVSRRHAVIMRDARGLYIQDLDSHNGIWVGDQRVSKVYIHDGLVVYLGEIPVRFRSRTS